MGSLFRSEKMELIQMILNSEASYLCVAELGELGCLQFRDLNENINSFEKKYTRDIRRCDEMERQIRFINTELKNSKVAQWNGSGSSVNSNQMNPDFSPNAPLPSEMAKLEEELQTIEGEIREVNKNYEALKSNFSAVKEVSHVLKKSEAFMMDTMYHSQGLSLSFNSGSNNDQSTSTNGGENNNLSSSAKLNFTAGTIARNRVNILEKILWRACHGKVLLRTYDIHDDSLTDKNNEVVEKSVFIVVYQGKNLQSKVKKIAEGIRATVYPIPEEPSERRAIELKIRSQIEDAQAVITQTEQHRTKLLTACSRQVRDWYQKIMKAKSIYHIHNTLTSGNGSTLIGEAWCPNTELENVKNALRIGTEKSGSRIPNIMEVMRSKRVPPTYHKTNKFTAGFQGLIDAYGICTYQEINPTPFTIISFPFLFGVMFGDIGHGLIMVAMALYMIIKERQLKNNDSDIFKMIFGGRYIVLMMGIFSTYCGFIYNDAFSKSFNFFGSTWSANSYDIPTKEGVSVGLDPNKTDVFHGPYFYGVDPIWQLTVNKILWSNSFKMKASIVFGIAQMVFGLLLKLENSRYFQNKLNIVAEWIPEMIFLNSIFSYLVVTIFAKWIFWPSSDSACAPSLLINLINIFMLKSSEKCTGNPHFSGGTPTYLYPGQDFVQKVLLLCALISVPWLLIMKPYVLYQRNKKRIDRSTGNFGGVRVSLDIGDNDRAAIMDFDQLDNEQDAGNGQTTTYDENNGDGKPKDQNDEFNMQEVVIYQIIHTIEFCLSCISHTASYLRLWALSLAHAQLSEVLWTMLLSFSLKANGGFNVIIKWVVFFFFSSLTVGILIAMEGLSAFLHALRLHWVEFNNKFFKGEGHAFRPFSFRAILSAPENEM